VKNAQACTSFDLSRRRGNHLLPEKEGAGARRRGFDTAQDPDAESKAELGLSINSA